MRTREEIEDQLIEAFENHSVRVWEQQHHQAQTELLLDIRDLLQANSQHHE
jgi:hypothetical protein